MSAQDLILTGFLLMVLTPIVAIDIAQRRIPDVWSLTLGLCGLAARLWREPSWRTLAVCAAAAAATALLLFLLVRAMRLLKRNDTLGMGDVKFMIAASIWVGFVGGAWTFVLASLIAAIVALTISPWRRVDLAAPFPFGPFLSAGLAVVFVLNALGR